MAWTALTFSVGQILTAAQMNNLQANFTALAQGLSGAPKIQDAALDTKIVDGENVRDMLAGPIYIGNWWLNSTSGPTAGRVPAEFMSPRSGTFRAFLGVTRTGGADTGCVSIGVNSVVVSSEYCWNSTGWGFWQEDIAVNQGDRIQLRVRATIGGNTLNAKCSIGVSSSTLVEKLTLTNSLFRDINENA